MPRSAWPWLAMCGPSSTPTSSTPLGRSYDLRVTAADLTSSEGRPLLGRRVVVTRARAQAPELVDRLQALGADVVESPAIEVVTATDDGTARREALTKIGSYDWLVLTSPNGVVYTFDDIPDVRALAGVQVAAVGTGTGAALADRRVVADLVPSRFVAEGLLEAFPAPPLGGGRVLLSVAEGARPVLPDGLRAAGWTVDVVAAYRTVPVVPDEATREAIADADAVTFTSSSTVTNFCRSVGTDAVPPVVVSIGPITSATARDEGLTVAREADPHTVDGVVDALLEALTDQ